MFAIQRSPELLPSSTLIPEREIASGNTVLSLSTSRIGTYETLTQDC